MSYQNEGYGVNPFEDDRDRKLRQHEQTSLLQSTSEHEDLDKLSFHKKSSGAAYSSYQNDASLSSSAVEQRLQQQLRETQMMMGGTSSTSTTPLPGRGDSNGGSSSLSQKGNIPSTRPYSAGIPAIHTYNESSLYSDNPVPTVAKIGLPEDVFRMRAINIGLSVTSALFGLLSLLTFLLTFSLRKLIMASYLSLLSGLLLAYELHTPYLKDIIEDNFGFLKSSIWRTIYIFMLSTLCFQIGGIGLLLGIGLFADGMYHIFVMRKFGKDDLEEQQDKVGSEDATSVLQSQLGGFPQPQWTSIGRNNKNIPRQGSEVVINGGGGYTVIQ